MSKGIVITTSEYTKDFLFDCLKSVGTKYPVLVHMNTQDNNGWELAGIQKGKENFDEFIHLMDTCIIKDVSLFDKLFAIEGHVFLTEGGYHYMGKFVSNDIPPLQNVTTKDQAIQQELRWLHGKQRTYFKPDLPVHTDTFELIHDQPRMRLSNDFIIKWKGTWSL